MKIFTFFLVFCASVLQLFGQAPPEAFNYSGAARDGSGNPLSEKTIGVEFSILASSASGTVVYRERHTVLTDVNGIFNLGIGLGSVQEGVFNTISWGENSYFLKVGLDSSGGTSYTVTGVTQLLSVPYALYAKKAGGVSGGLKPVVDVQKNNGFEYFDSNVVIDLEGIVYSEGSSEVTESGIVWSENPNPTVSDNKLVYSTGGGWFQGDVSIPLSGKQDIFYRAFAVNENGVSYSNRNFKAELNPLNALFDIDSITKESPFVIKLGVNYDNPSGNNFKAQVCWDTIPNSRSYIGCYTLGQYGTTYTDYYNVRVTNLLPNTTYYFTPLIPYTGALITGDGIVSSNNSYYYGQEVSVFTDSFNPDYDGMYVGVITQNSINTLATSFEDTVYVTVDPSNNSAIFKSKFFGERSIELDLRYLTSNVKDLTVLKDLEYPTTAGRPLRISGSAAPAARSVSFTSSGLSFDFNLSMFYYPKTMSEVGPLGAIPVLFLGEYTKQ